MNSYTIVAESCCDLNNDLLNELNIITTNLSLSFENEAPVKNNQISASKFYERMRKGETAITSACNCDDYTEAFLPQLNAGNDILYIGFTSGLSSTFQSAKIAAEELKEKFPERRIVTIDSLCASTGYGMLLYYTAQKRDSGANLDEITKYVESVKLSICHHFTVGDLKYLKRGGRISGATALVGSIMGIKPMLHLDNEGHLVMLSKVRGRKNSLLELAKRYEELKLDSADTVFINHADSKEDAKKLAQIFRNDYKVNNVKIFDIGPVIGAHSGPDTIAVFFLGKQR